MEFSRYARDRLAEKNRPLAGGLSKLSSVVDAEVDVVLDELGIGRPVGHRLPERLPK
jgi:hypothetical protein